MILISLSNINHNAAKASKNDAETTASVSSTSNTNLDGPPIQTLKNLNPATHSSIHSPESSTEVTGKLNNNENSSCFSPKIQFNTLLNQSQINNQLVSTNNKQFTFKVDEYVYRHFFVVFVCFVTLMLAFYHIRY